MHVRLPQGLTALLFSLFLFHLISFLQNAQVLVGLPQGFVAMLFHYVYFVFISVYLFNLIYSMLTSAGAGAGRDPKGVGGHAILYYIKVLLF